MHLHQWMICVNVDRPTEWAYVWFFWAAWRGSAEGIHKEKGLKGEMAQLIKAPFIICLCFSPSLLSLFHHHHAEKMRRQRLYSNVIREQNKKISRIPFLPSKDAEGNDKTVPRMKVCVCVWTRSRWWKIMNNVYCNISIDHLINCYTSMAYTVPRTVH